MTSHFGEVPTLLEAVHEPENTIVPARAKRSVLVPIGNDADTSFIVCAINGLQRHLNPGPSGLEDIIVCRIIRHHRPILCLRIKLELVKRPPVFGSRVNLRPEMMPPRILWKRTDSGCHRNHSIGIPEIS